MPQKPKSSKTLCGTCAVHLNLPAHQRVTVSKAGLHKCVGWKLATRSVEEHKQLINFFTYRVDILTRQLEVVKDELQYLKEIDTSLVN
jgi:hypothetical protein